MVRTKAYKLVYIVREGRLFVCAYMLHTHLLLLRFRPVLTQLKFVAAIHEVNNVSSQFCKHFKNVVLIIQQIHATAWQKIRISRFKLTFQSRIVKNTCKTSLVLVSPKCTTWLGLRYKKFQNFPCIFQCKSRYLVKATLRSDVRMKSVFQMGKA